MCGMCIPTTTATRTTGTSTTATTATTTTGDLQPETVPVDALPLIDPSSKNMQSPTFIDATAALTPHGIAYVSDWRHLTKATVDAIVHHRQQFELQSDSTGSTGSMLTLGVIKSEVTYTLHLRRAREEQPDAAKLPCEWLEETGPGVEQLAAQFAALILGSNVIKPADMIGVFGGCTNEKQAATVNLNVYLLRSHSKRSSEALQKLLLETKVLLEADTVSEQLQFQSEGLSTVMRAGEGTVTTLLSAIELRKRILADQRLSNDDGNNPQSTSSEAPAERTTASASTSLPYGTNGASDGFTRGDASEFCAGQTLLGLVVLEDADEQTFPNKETGLQTEAEALVDQSNSILFSSQDGAVTESSMALVTCASGAPGMLVASLYISSDTPATPCQSANNVLAKVLDGQSHIFSLSNQPFKALAFIPMDCVLTNSTDNNVADGDSTPKQNEIAGRVTTSPQPWTSASQVSSSSTSTSSAAPDMYIDDASSSNSAFQIQGQSNNSSSTSKAVKEVTIPVIVGASVLCFVAVLVFLVWLCRRRRLPWERAPWGKESEYEAVDDLQRRTGVVRRESSSTDAGSNATAYMQPSEFYEDEWFPGNGRYEASASIVESTTNRAGTNAASKRPAPPARQKPGSYSSSGSKGSKGSERRPGYKTYESRYAVLGGGGSGSRLGGAANGLVQDYDQNGPLNVEDNNIHLFEQAEFETKSQPNSNPARDKKSKKRSARGMSGDGNSSSSDADAHRKPPSYDVTFGFKSHSFKHSGRNRSRGILDSSMFVFEGGDQLAAETDVHGPDEAGAAGELHPFSRSSPAQSSPASSAAAAKSSAPLLSLEQPPEQGEALMMLRSTMNTINVVRKQGSAAEGLGGLRRSPVPPVYSFENGGGMGSSSADVDSGGGGSSMSIQTRAAAVREYDHDETRKRNSSSSDGNMSPWLIEAVSSKHPSKSSSNRKAGRTARRVKKGDGALIKEWASEEA